MQRSPLFNLQSPQPSRSAPSRRRIQAIPLRLRTPLIPSLEPHSHLRPPAVLSTHLRLYQRMRRIHVERGTMLCWPHLHMLQSGAEACLAPTGLHRYSSRCLLLPCTRMALISSLSFTLAAWTQTLCSIRLRRLQHRLPQLSLRPCPQQIQSLLRLPLSERRLCGNLPMPLFLPLLLPRLRLQSLPALV